MTMTQHERLVREPYPGHPRVEVTSTFWTSYRDLITSEVLPYQWAVMNDETLPDLPADPAGNAVSATNSHAIRNLRIAAGLESGHHAGFPFQDTDVYKWLEAAAYSLVFHPDDRLRAICDRLIDLIAAAQEDDGYLSTLFQIDLPERRFARIQESHELYTMGHFIEAAVAYREATGTSKALEIARRMAACIDAAFGPEEGKIHGADGHPEIELALVRLHDATGERRWLDLARYFLDVRGRDAAFFARQAAEDSGGPLIPGMEAFPLSYYQAEAPIEQQETAHGHAVRFGYLAAAVADVARHTADPALLAASRRFWEDAVRRRMYVTGQVGSTRIGESFTYDYDLPNDTVYGETCASVSMAFFARRMLEIEPRGEYGDVLEKELFNGALAGMSLDGKHFFYVNPLEADPRASAGDPGKSHVLTRRADWFNCACCPSNVARLLADVHEYLYTETDEAILAHQFIANRAEFADGIRVEQRSDLPWHGTVRFEVRNPERSARRLAVRIPEWSRRQFELRIDGAPATVPIEHGFAWIDIDGPDTVVELRLDMTVRYVAADPRVREDIGRIAVQRGPLVYCAEEADNPAPLWTYRVPVSAPVADEFDPDSLGGIVRVTVRAERRCAQEPEGHPAAPGTFGDNEGTLPLYRSATEARWETVPLDLVPYYTWANRAEGQMTVWFHSDT